MPKRSPEQRWRDQALERVTAFSHSAELKRLRMAGLAILGRESLLGAGEWSHRAHGKMNTEEFRGFEDECGRVGQTFGLAQWTVEWASLMKVLGICE